MKQLRLTLLLLRPSPFSLTVTFFLSVGVIGLANYSYFTRDEMLYEYFYGEFGMITIFQGYADELLDRLPILSDQSFIYNVFVFVAAILSGLIVYLVLQALTKVLSVGLSDYIAVQDAPSVSEKKHAATETGVRWFLRGVTLFGWIAFWSLFAGVILPFCILLARVGINDLYTLHGWIRATLGLTILIVSIHMHAIFMRALVLRPRLFGGESEIIETMARRSISTKELK